MVGRTPELKGLRMGDGIGRTRRVPDAEHGDGGQPGRADKGSPLVGHSGTPDGGLGERSGGPCGARGARVLAAVEGFLKGRKACRAPHCAPLVPREGGESDLLSDKGGCSSREGTRHAADTGRMAVAVGVAGGHRGGGEKPQGVETPLGPHAFRGIRESGAELKILTRNPDSRI